VPYNVREPAPTRGRGAARVTVAMINGYHIYTAAVTHGPPSRFTDMAKASADFQANLKVPVASLPVRLMQATVDKAMSEGDPLFDELARFGAHTLAGSGWQAAAVTVLLSHIRYGNC
jgi:hypothetical protein